MVCKTETPGEGIIHRHSHSVLEGKVEDLTDLGGAGGPAPHLGLEGEVAPAVGDHLVAIHPHHPNTIFQRFDSLEICSGYSPVCIVYGPGRLEAR